MSKKHQNQSTNNIIRGFTLIELLAVIVILAVIALIATPLIMNVIEDARDGTLKNSARYLLRTAEMEYAVEQMNNPNPTIDFNTLEYKGERMDAIAGSFDENGKASIAVYKGNKCVYQRFEDEDVILEKGLTEEECLAKVGGEVLETITVEGLISKANDASITDYNAGNKGEMYTFTHEATEQTGALTDYRYIGNTPNNYITFNNETWRIIGVIEGRIKIIKDTSIGVMSWDHRNGDGIGGCIIDYSGCNDWKGSQIMYTLNGRLSPLQSGYSFDGDYIRDNNNYIVYQLGCEPALITKNNNVYNCIPVQWALSDNAIKQIANETYYLGLTRYYSTNEGEEVYIDERSGDSNWNGMVGLIYLSDYLYTYAYGVDDTCYHYSIECDNSNPSSSWLFINENQWFISHEGSTTEMAGASFVFSNGGRGFQPSVADRMNIRPTVYLKSDIVLSNSQGTIDDPYIVFTS